MESRTHVLRSGPENIELAKKYLELIADIAARGARSLDPDQAVFALQELSQVLFERTGDDETYFEMLPADKIPGLQWLYEELDFVQSGSQSLEANERRQRRFLQ